MQKAVFLDKDGTLIDDVPYNIDPEKITLAHGCKNGLKQLNSYGYRLIVVSNQPGIAQGYFTLTDLKKTETALARMCAQFGVYLAAFYYCPHDPNGKIREYSISCSCRKPQAGLLKQAAREHAVGLQESWFVGDVLNDVEAGRRAGCRTILIDNGNETEWLLTPARTPHFIVSDLEEASGIICGQDSV